MISNNIKNASRIISTYSADIFGVCSALYELGGMVIMHDASGCNSTYTTHDEPRWYDIESNIFISALTEAEAIFGDDDKLINEICDAAEDLEPKFIAIAGTPVPTMIGTDLKAIASVIEQRTGIPSFGFHTTGMNSYIHGASLAFETLVSRFCGAGTKKQPELSVNIIGATPLDFSVNGSIQSIKKWLSDEGFKITSCFSMGDYSSLENISNSGSANVSLVISESGLAAAQRLESMFGIPYVAGVPIGKAFSEVLSKALKSAACRNTSDTEIFADRNPDENSRVIIGESVFSASLAQEMLIEYGINSRVISPLGNCCLQKCDAELLGESDIENAVKNASEVIADPLYKPIVNPSSKFTALPHEGFSGRIYRKDIPDMINNNLFLERKLK